MTGSKSETDAVASIAGKLVRTQGVTSPAGFRAAGIPAGIKASGRSDLALVFNEGPDFTAAGVFTRNKVKAAPVLWSQQVLTTGRLFCSRYVTSLPVRIVRCPVPFPPLTYYQLWHDLTQSSASGRWLREQVRDVARNLSGHGMLQRSAA